MDANKITAAAVVAYAGVVVWGIYQEYKFEKDMREWDRQMAHIDADLEQNMNNLRDRLNLPHRYNNRALDVEVINISRN